MRVGEHKIGNNGKDCSVLFPSECSVGHQDIEIEDVITHPSYSPPRLYQHDIAILRLKDNITENGMKNRFI